MKKSILFILIAFLGQVTLLAQKDVTRVEPVPEGVNPDNEKVLKRKVAIARFSNETKYAKGLFYDKDNDPLQKQASDLLSAKLASSGKFILLERSDLDKVLEEQQNNPDVDKKPVGADYIIVGSITQYGRKNVGDARVFSRTKTQMVEAAVSVRLIDVSSGVIIYSDEAKGEAELRTKTTLGVGGTADYDATLDDKAISMAISKLVENIINNCMDRPWKAYFLTADDDAIIISGGKSQGINEGDTFRVFKKGKKVRNPQTGLDIELPGKQVGTIRITGQGGDTVESEYSLVEFTDGEIDFSKLTDYYIEENEP